MKAADELAPGDWVEVGRDWAYGSEIAWYRGYVVDRLDGLTVLVRDVRWPRRESPVRFARHRVRRVVYGPRPPEGAP